MAERHHEETAEAGVKDQLDMPRLPDLGFPVS
jgi:hypothetical protein